jgi:ferredoxin, 2Fe-2S
MTRIVFVDASGKEHQIEAADGLSVMEALRGHAPGIQGECEGSLACATCHVWIDPAWAHRLEQPTDDEADMLDCAFNVREHSRLSCQIRIGPDIDGLRCELPRRPQPQDKPAG